MPQCFTKQPFDKVDYEFDLEQWLVPTSGDTLLSANVSASPSSITLGIKTVNSTNVIQFISGGVDGIDYKITCQVTTVQGRDKEAEIFIAVRDK